MLPLDKDMDHKMVVRGGEVKRDEGSGVNKEGEWNEGELR